MVGRGLLFAAFLLAGSAALAAEELPPDTPPRALVLDTLVPASAAAYLEVLDLKAFGVALREAKLVKLAEQTRLKALRLLGVGFLQFASVQFTGESLETYGELLSKGVGLAVEDLDAEKKGQKPAIVLLADDATGRIRKLIDDRLRPNLQRSMPRVRFGAERFRDHTIHFCYVPEKDPFCYAFARDTLLLGSEAGLKWMLGSLADGKPTLSRVEGYQHAREKVGIDCGAMLFGNMQKIWQNALQEEGKSEKEKAELLATGLTAIQWLGFSTTFGAEGAHDLLYLYTGGAREGLLKLLTQEQMRTTKGHTLVPQTFSIYKTQVIGDGNQLWQLVREMVSRSGGEEGLRKLDEGIQSMQTQFGVTFKEGVLDTIGGEVFVAIDTSRLPEQVAEGASLKPKNLDFVLGIETKAPAALAESIRTFVYSQPLFADGMERYVEEVRRIQVSSLRYPKWGTQANPTYAFVDSFFLFSLKPGPVKAAVEAHADRKTLATDASFVAHQQRLPRRVIGGSFYDLQRSLDGFLAELEDHEQANVAPYVPCVRQIVEQLDDLATATVVDANGLRTEIHSDTGLPLYLTLLSTAIKRIRKGQHRNVDRTRERMTRIRDAIDEFYRRRGTFPENLAQLPNSSIEAKDLVDPYGRGQNFRYSPGPPIDPQAKPRRYWEEWILVSNGPDKTPDLDVTKYDPKRWQQMNRPGQATPEESRFLKKALYQFRKDEFLDERSPKDEGDLVLTGTMPKRVEK